MTAITPAMFGMIMTLILNNMTNFANALDSAVMWSGTGFTWLDLLVSMAYIEISFDFVISLVYGDTNV